MIKTPTVFVLGAGASMPYGFPSGRQLVEQIYCTALGNFKETSDNKWINSGLISAPYIRNILNDMYGAFEVEKFGKALRLSQQSSIDAFLEHRTEFTDIGKFSIALFILRAEIEDKLFDYDARNHGSYQYIFDKLNASWGEFGRNVIGFVTFNYDRSLEHFLFTSIQNTYNKSNEECAQIISKIPIIHVYGLLGKLPWQAKDGIPYGVQKENRGELVFSTQSAEIASKQITVIAEDQSTSRQFDDAFQILANADRVLLFRF